MSIFDADSLLDDFELEAKAHIDTIEAAFLDVGVLSGEPRLLDDIFRAAHSIKGTAGFFSLEKVVAVAHELESVFSRVKDGELALTDDIADVALQSVDTLKALTANLRSQEIVQTDAVMALLKRYSEPPHAEAPETPQECAANVPFDLTSPEIAEPLQSAQKRGHHAYYIGATSSEFGKYGENPASLLGEITAVGVILKAKANAAPIAIAELSSAIAAAERLDLLLTSILEPELFMIAVELEPSFVHVLAKDMLQASAGSEDAATGSENRTNGAENAKSMAQDARDVNIANRDASDVNIEDNVPRDLSNKPSSSITPIANKTQHAAKPDFSLRLPIGFVNELMDLANEMVLSRNQLLSRTSKFAREAGLTPVLQNVSRLTNEIHARVLRSRMQPVGVVFEKFPRIIRDTAKALGKDLRVEIHGSDVALDKYLLDAISDPITQLVKNSADHGIESAAQRAAAEKPPKGVITLNAFTRDGLAIIEVSDDGAGIDDAALRRKLRERGARTDEQLAAMTRGDVVKTIFEPGLSTAKNVTSVSGRGVGMDIVKANIEKLGGTIEIDTEPGKGTTTRLKLPLTLSVIRTLIIRACGVPFAVPEANVERIVRVAPKAAGRSVELINGALALNLDGWVLPLITFPAMEAASQGLEAQYAKSVASKSSKSVVKCLVLRSGTRHFALLIDDALKSEETLIKPLPLFLRRCRCYSSVTVLGSGSAVMVLDAGGILRHMDITGIEKPKEAAQPAAETFKRVVFKSSGTEYFAVDAALVSRVERIDPAAIQLIDGKPFINVSGATYRLLPPESVLNAPPNQSAWRYLVVLNSKAPAALPAAQILGHAQTPAPARAPIGGEWVTGSTIEGDRILLHLDIGGMLGAG